MPTSCDLLCSPFLTPEFLILPLPRSLDFSCPSSPGQKKQN